MGLIIGVPDFAFSINLYSIDICTILFKRLSPDSIKFLERLGFLSSLVIVVFLFLFPGLNLLPLPVLSLLPLSFFSPEV